MKKLIFAIFISLLICSSGFAGTTANFGWDYGTQYQDPWWNIWTGIMTDIDSDLYDIKHGTTVLDDIKTKSPWVDVRAYMDGIGGRPTYATWFANQTTTDVTAVIQAAYNSITKGEVRLPEGIFLFTSTFHMTSHGINLIGAGQRISIIRFNPSAGDIAIHVELSPPGTAIAQCQLKGFTLDGTGDTTHQKIGIQVVDGEEIIIDDIAVSNWTGATSIGIQLKGRQTHTLSHLTINTDLPIDIEDNPNSIIDLDHYVFRDCYFTSKSDNTQPVINIGDGVNVENLSFEGYQAWVFGSHGLYWADTTTTLISLHISIKNVRWEQSTAGAGHYMIYISHNTNVQNLLIENTRCGSTTNLDNIYLRKCIYVGIKDSTYAGTGTALNVDSTVERLNIDNCFFQIGSTVTATNTIPVLVNDGTPSVAGMRVCRTGGTTAITNFINGFAGQVLTIVSEHTVTITDGTNIFLAGSANFVMDATDTLTLIQKADGKWYELGRSDN